MLTDIHDVPFVPTVILLAGLLMIWVSAGFWTAIVVAAVGDLVLSMVDWLANRRDRQNKFPT